MSAEILIVKNSEDLDRAGESTNKIVVDSGACNDPSTCEWDLSRCKELTELVVGDNCFQHVNKLKLIGMSKLKSVEIWSFQQSHLPQFRVGSFQQSQKCPKW